ncbi:MAG: helix-turn-helix domain-containing protein [Streptosporangiales bacterium]|nr:helix-turn-helix domain-containing protein [Streptosporangiales bacterium]
MPSRPPVSPALAPFVRTVGYFEFDLAHRRERVLPTGSAQLLLNLADDRLTSEAAGTAHRTAGAALSGVWSSHAEIDPAQQRSIVCVGFVPGGAYPFFSAPAAATAGSLVDLGDLWGRDGAVLRERLLEAPTVEARLRIVEEALLARAVRPLRIDPAVRHAVSSLHRGDRVGDVVERLGTTPKRFIRTFADQVGVTPKRFARIRRFQRVLQAVPHDRPVDWAALAASSGYADQAHLVHEFRTFAGVSPTGYRARSAAERNHVVLPD